MIRTADETPEVPESIVPDETVETVASEESLLSDFPTPWPPSPRVQMLLIGVGFLAFNVILLILFALVISQRG